MTCDAGVAWVMVEGVQTHRHAGVPTSSDETCFCVGWWSYPVVWPSCLTCHANTHAPS